MSAGVYVRTEEIHFKPKICARYGKEFKPTGSNQKYCEECVRERRQEIYRNWKQKNPEKVREHSKNWRQENKEHNKEYHKHWRQENKEYYRQWRKEHPDRVREIAKKQYNKRYRNLGFILLNKYSEGFEAHHIDRNYVIFIPREVHRSIYHSVTKNINMDEINAVAFNYL